VNNDVRDGERIPFPESFAWVTVEQERASVMLSVLVDGVTANCFFFTRHEIELDIDTREVKSEAAFESVLKLMRFIACATCLTVVAVPEGGDRKSAFLRAPPSGDAVYVV
jgi:hypothetical protein